MQLNSIGGTWILAYRALNSVIMRRHDDDMAIQGVEYEGGVYFSALSNCTTVFFWKFLPTLLVYMELYDITESPIFNHTTKGYLLSQYVNSR